MDTFKNTKTLSVRQVILPLILSVSIFLILLSGYFKERRFNQNDYNSPISSIVLDTKNSIETLIDQNRLSLSLILSVFKVQRLDNLNLDSTYQNLIKIEPYLYGIGVMDENGKIISEAGISLSEYNNSSNNQWAIESDWLKNSRSYGYSVSNIYSIKDQPKYFIIAVNNDNVKTVYAVISIQGLTQYLKTKIRYQLIPSTSAYLLEQSASEKPQTLNQIQILSSGSNSFKPIQSIPDIQPEGILVEVNNQDSLSTGFVKIENTPWTLAITLSPQKQKFLFLNSNLIKVVLGIIMLIIMTVYIFVLKQKNMLIAKTIKQTPIKNIESFSKKSSIGHLSESMVHEINNPLEIINQNAGLLKDILEMSGDVKSIGEMKLRDKFVHLTDGILEGVDRSRHVMNRFLKFAKNINNEKLQADVNIMLQDIIDLCNEEAMYQDILIELHKGHSVPNITKGANLAQHIFFNILSFIINDVKKDTSIIVSSEQKANLFINVTFNYSKTISNSNKRADVHAINARRHETLEQNDIRLTVAREFLEKINGSMKVVALDEFGVSIIITIPI
jgi:two-component system NtrC family sensor kinase